MLAAIITGRESVELREVESRPPAPGEVAIAVACAGICGSDLHRYRGRWKPGDTAPGHEISGRVAALGRGVEGWKVGDRVTCEGFGHCGRCAHCLAGWYNHCDSLRWNDEIGHQGFSEQATLPASGLFSIAGLTDEQGALVEPLAVGVRAASRLGDLTGKRVAVIGAGTIGLLSALAAGTLGAAGVTVFARYPHQAGIARRIGLRDVRLEPPETEAGFPLVIDSAASSESLGLAVRMVEPLGRIVEAGCPTVPSRVNLAPLFSKEAVLTGSSTYAYSGARRDFDVAIEWIRSGRVDPTPLITHRFPLCRIAEAFAVAADKSSGAVKVMVRPA